MSDPTVELARVQKLMLEDEQKMREFEKKTSGKKPDLAKAEGAVRTAEANLKKAEGELEKAKAELEETHNALKDLSGVTREKSELENKMTLDKLSREIK